MSTVNKQHRLRLQALVLRCVRDPVCWFKNYVIRVAMRLGSFSLIATENVTILEMVITKATNPDFIGG